MKTLVPVRILLLGVLLITLSPLASGQTIENVPGYTDPANYASTCFSFMGAVEFTSAYRFAAPDGSGNGSSSTADTPYRLAGYTVPLIADLNGDGLPEIIALAKSSGNTGVGNFHGISIHNGQTGKRIVKLPFKNSSQADITTSFTGDVYHSSPSPMALVRISATSNVSVLMAFPDGGGGTAGSGLQNKLVRYDIIPSPGNTYTLQYVWESTQWYNYDFGNSDGTRDDFHKPIPTIVDLDGNGSPEALVYNRIYDVETGALLLRLRQGAAANAARAFIGNDPKGRADDQRVGGFSYVYDLDLDGIYDVAAGGQLYRIRTDGGGLVTGEGSALAVFSADTIFAPSSGGVAIADGYTGVADINGDGLPDIVTSYTEVSSTTEINSSGSNHSTAGARRVVVWNPGFFQMNSTEPDREPVLDASGNFIRNATPQPYIMANVYIYFTRGSLMGNYSYTYIGDIDGKTHPTATKDRRLPEIAILGGKLAYKTYSMAAAEFKHPTVSGLGTGTAGTSGPLPASGVSSREGDLIALTWDATAGLAFNKRLKLSFVLEHEDRSSDTGFTMFDFDNDGVMEICYRDEEYLRIIKPQANVPYISYTETAANKGILFRKSVRHGTGYEYPSIADIDNDGSAEMVVMGQSVGSSPYYGFLYAVGNDGTGEKFAPARKVWTQFMYDPFKINDDLTTPVGAAHAINRLVPEYTFSQEIRDANDNIIETVAEYRPFNATLNQIPYFHTTEREDGKPLFDPVVFLHEACIRPANDATEGKRPKIVTESSTNYIYITVGNRSTAQTVVSSAIPIAVYDEFVGSARQVYKTTLSACTYVTGGTGTVGTRTLQPGEEIRVRLTFTGLGADKRYIVRLGDDSGGSPWVWR
ncbi:MAG: VCBS repeat-containing protein, partial [Tannerellaceae bacterium]|nr:VCBS repeat-containing protein [Tannerellaceae bacterium]